MKFCKGFPSIIGLYISVIVIDHTVLCSLMSNIDETHYMKTFFPKCLPNHQSRCTSVMVLYGLTGWGSHGLLYYFDCYNAIFSIILYQKCYHYKAMFPILYHIDQTLHNTDFNALQGALWCTLCWQNLQKSVILQMQTWILIWKCSNTIIALTSSYS